MAHLRLHRFHSACRVVCKVFVSIMLCFVVCLSIWNIVCVTLVSNCLLCTPSLVYSHKLRAS